MNNKLVFGFLLAMMPYLNANATGMRHCGTHEFTLVERLIRNSKTQEILKFRTAEQRQSYQVPVYFHVIASGDTIAQGNVTDENIVEQIEVNQADVRRAIGAGGFHAVFALKPRPLRWGIHLCAEQRLFDGDRCFGDAHFVAFIQNRHQITGLADEAGGLERHHDQLRKQKRQVRRRRTLQKRTQNKCRRLPGCFLSRQKGLMRKCRGCCWKCTPKASSGPGSRR